MFVSVKLCDKVYTVGPHGTHLHYTNSTLQPIDNPEDDCLGPVRLVGLVKILLSRQYTVCITSAFARGAHES